MNKALGLMPALYKLGAVVYACKPRVKARITSPMSFSDT